MAGVISGVLRQARRTQSDAWALREEALAPDKECFIRKAIGWPLRDNTRRNPQALRGFAAEQRPRL